MKYRCVTRSSLIDCEGQGPPHVLETLRMTEIGARGAQLSQSVSRLRQAQLGRNLQGHLCSRYGVCEGSRAYTSSSQLSIRIHELGPWGTPL